MRHIDVRSRVTIGLCAAALALTLASCGSDGDTPPDDTSPSPTATSEASETPSATGTADPGEAITVTSCERDAAGTITASVAVTNSGDTPVIYITEVYFVGPDGTRYSTGPIAPDVYVDPGKTVNGTFTSTATVPDGTTCEAKIVDQVDM